MSDRFFIYRADLDAPDREEAWIRTCETWEEARIAAQELAQKYDLDMVAVCIPDDKKGIRTIALWRNKIYWTVYEGCPLQPPYQVGDMLKYKEDGKIKIGEIESHAFHPEDNEWGFTINNRYVPMKRTFGKVDVTTVEVTKDE